MKTHERIPHSKKLRELERFSRKLPVKRLMALLPVNGGRVPPLPKDLMFPMTKQQQQRVLDVFTYLAKRGYWSEAEHVIRGGRGTECGRYLTQRHVERIEARRSRQEEPVGLSVASLVLMTPLYMGAFMHLLGLRGATGTASTLASPQVLGGHF